MKISRGTDYALLLGILVTFTASISVEKDLALTLSEKITVDKFRARVAPLLTKRHMQFDLYLARWLRARDFNINAAETMFLQHLKWRTEWDVDSVLQEDWSDLKLTFPVTMDSYDKEGRPDIRDWDIRGAIFHGAGRRHFRYVIYILEKMIMQVYEQQAKGMNVTQWTVLGSADGFNEAQHLCKACSRSWIMLAHVVENNYIGWTHELIIVDATPIAGSLLGVIQPLISAVSREAIRIFNTDKEKWISYLDERIAKGQRPKYYGGTRITD